MEQLSKIKSSMSFKTLCCKNLCAKPRNVIEAYAK